MVASIFGGCRERWYWAVRKSGPPPGDFNLRIDPPEVVASQL